jgi:hypothetical protein
LSPFADGRRLGGWAAFRSGVRNGGRRNRELAVTVAFAVIKVGEILRVPAARRRIVDAHAELEQSGFRVEGRIAAHGKFAERGVLLAQALAFGILEEAEVQQIEKARDVAEEGAGGQGDGSVAVGVHERLWSLRTRGTKPAVVVVVLHGQQNLLTGVMERTNREIP